MKASVYVWKRPGDYVLAAEAVGKQIYLELFGKTRVPPQGDAALCFGPGTVERISVGAFGDLDIYCAGVARFHVFSNGARYAVKSTEVAA